MLNRWEAPRTLTSPPLHCYLHFTLGMEWCQPTTLNSSAILNNDSDRDARTQSTVILIWAYISTNFPGRIAWLCLLLPSCLSRKKEKEVESPPHHLSLPTVRPFVHHHLLLLASPNTVETNRLDGTCWENWEEMMADREPQKKEDAYGALDHCAALYPIFSSLPTHLLP